MAVSSKVSSRIAAGLKRFHRAYKVIFAKPMLLSDTTMDVLRRGLRRILFGGWVVLLASMAYGQKVVLDDPLQDSTTGARAGGEFVEGGWQVTGHNDTIYWHVPPLAHGAVEWDIRGLNPGEGRAGMEDKCELFHMYDHTVGDADVKYLKGYRDNPFKHFVRKIGKQGGATDALELVWQISPKYEEPDTKVLFWDPKATYRFREEWGPDGAGNTPLKTYRDGVLLRTMTVPGRWTPKGLSVRIAASPRSPTAADCGAPLDAIYSHLKVWDLTEPPPPLPKPRPGKVSLDKHALRDDAGEFLGLGASYFQALRRAKYDRPRLRSDLDFLARRGFNYIRVLSMVGWNPAWEGKEITPVTFENKKGKSIAGWDDYSQQLKDLIDIAYDEYGLRTELTIFADAQFMTKADRTAHLDRVLDVLQGREQKVILLEVANEYWQNGFPDPEGTADLREIGQYLAKRTKVLIALSSPPEGTAAGLERMYQKSAAHIATQHFSRDIRGVEGGWRAVRDPWWVNSAAGIPPGSSNEPIGPGSSVSSENDPIKLVSAAAYAWMSGLPMYVYHTNAGVGGVTRFEEMAGVGDYRRLAAILPADIANWPQRTEGLDRFAPFVTYADGQADRWLAEVAGATSGAVRHLSCVKEDRFVTLPIGIGSAGLPLSARRDLTLQVFHPLTGDVVHELMPSANEKFTLPQGPQAYLIKGRYAGNRPATIDLGTVNEIDGLAHPHTDDRDRGDGNTVAVTVGGREARKNENPKQDFYMYFAVADWFAHQGNHPDLYLTIEYLDAGNGSLALQYDSKTGLALPAFYQSGGTVALGATGQWKQHTFHLTAAYFGNRQNHAADFRIFGGKGPTFYLDRVEVSLTPPAEAR